MGPCSATSSTLPAQPGHRGDADPADIGGLVDACDSLLAQRAEIERILAQLGPTWTRGARALNELAAVVGHRSGDGAVAAEAARARAARDALIIAAVAGGMSRRAVRGRRG